MVRPTPSFFLQQMDRRGAPPISKPLAPAQPTTCLLFLRHTLEGCAVTRTRVPDQEIILEPPRTPPRDGHRAHRGLHPRCEAHRPDDRRRADDPSKRVWGHAHGV